MFSSRRRRHDGVSSNNQQKWSDSVAGDPHVKRRDLIACTLPLVAQIGLGCLGMVGTHAHNIRFERQHVFNTHEVRP